MYFDKGDFICRLVFEKFAAANQQNSNVPAEVVVKIDVPEMPRQILKFRATDIMQCSLEHFEKTQANESQPPPQTRAPEDVSPSSACNKQYHVTPRNHGNHPEIGQRSGALINQEQVHTRNQYMNNSQIEGLVNNIHPVYRNEMRSTYQTASNEKSPAINPVHQPQTYQVYRAYQHTAQPYAPATSYIPKPQANLTLHIPQPHRNEMVTSETTLAPRNQFVSEHHHHQPVIQTTQDSPSTNVTPEIQGKSPMSANQNQAGHNQNQRIQQTMTIQEANPSNSSHANIPLSSTHQSPISDSNQQTHHSSQIYPSPHRHLGLSMPLLQSSSVPTHHPRSNLPPCNSNLHTYADQTREDDTHQARVQHLQTPQTQSQNDDEAIPEHVSSDISRTTQVPDQTVHPNNSPDDAMQITSLKAEKSKGRKRALDQDRVADLNVIQTTPVSRKRGHISTNTTEPKAKRKYVKRKRPESEKVSPDQNSMETSTKMQRDCEQVIRPTVINRCPRMGEEVACSEALSNQARSLNDNENSPAANSHVRQSPPRTMSPAKTRSSDNSSLEKPASHTPPADYISIPQQTVNNCQSTDTRTSHPTQCTDPPQVNQDTSSIITPRPTGDTRLKDFRMRPPAPTQSALRDQVVNSSYPSIKNPPINREHTEYQKPPEKLSPPGPSPQNAQIKELLMKPPLIPQPTPPHFTHQSAHNNDHQHIHVADQMHHVNSYPGQTRELVQHQPRPPPPPYTMPPNYVSIPHPSTVLHQQQAWFPRPPNLLQQTTRPSHPYSNQYYPSNNNHYSPLVIAPNPLLTPPQSLDRQSSPLYRPLPYFPPATGYDPTVGIPMTPPSEDLVRPDTINQNATMLTASIGVYNQDANRQYFFKEMEYPPGQTVGPWRNAALAMPGVYPN